MTTMHYSADYCKRASACKRCKQKFEKGELRIAKLSANPFSDDGEMKAYHHAKCIFESFSRVRATTHVIEGAEDVDGWAQLAEDDKETLKKLIKDLEEARGKKKGGGNRTPTKSPRKVTATSPEAKRQVTLDEVFKKDAGSKGGEEHSEEEEWNDEPGSSSSPSRKGAHSRQDGDEETSWQAFCELCDEVARVGGYKAKTEIIRKFLEAESFNGDWYLVCKLLLPGKGGVERVYNVNSKQLVKLYSQIFGVNSEKMDEDLSSRGDVAETIRIFFEENKEVVPVEKSFLTIQEVDAWLEELTALTADNDQQKHLAKITKRCTPEDLLMIIREIKKDLRTNAGPKHVLEALDPKAYDAFQMSRDLRSVVNKVLAGRSSPPGLKKELSVSLKVGVPLKPMLAEACRSVKDAIQKCPKGMFAEIKYDGERLQVHKSGTRFSYFSRSLKPMTPHKVEHLKEFIPRAFPTGADLVLDAEVLLVDNESGKPLPFGSLGVHKKEGFKNASVCLFVFDCMYYNGESLINKTIRERKKILEENMTPIRNRIMFSVAEVVTDAKKLRTMINEAIRDGLEGLVLKDVDSKYEPGKRHWLKVKKDYLGGGLADTADLIVLGAFFGTGNKGGIMSVFLMGVYDPGSKTFKTVTKCGNGHDDAALAKINKEMKENVERIYKDSTKVPDWLDVKSSLVPDFVVKDPKKSPIWEITGAEFSKSENHTARGISIRFPRVTRIRDDKSWDTATNLLELEKLVKESKVKTDILPEEDVSPKKTDGDGTTTGHRLSTLLESWLEGESSDQAESPRRRGAAANKRSASSEEEGEAEEEKASGRTEKSPAKRRRRREPCRYGKKCYQKSVQHKEQFSHPGDIDEETTSEEDESNEMFHSFAFFLPKALARRGELERFIAFFDGEVVDELHVEQATHVVFDDATADKDKEIEPPKGAKRVPVSWLWKCVRARKLLPSP